MLPRRGVDDDQVVLVLVVEQAELIEGHIVVAGHEPGGQRPVQGVGQKGLGRRGVGGTITNQLVPGPAHLDHQHPEAPLDGPDRDQHRLPVEPVDTQSVGQPPGRIDGDHQDPTSMGPGRPGTEGGGHRGLANPASADHDQNRLSGQEAVDLLDHRSFPTAAITAPTGSSGRSSTSTGVMPADRASSVSS